ncbi:hypothetical protein PENSPDRAFT_655748 [Peniophora sp. CONT]|nr:hypothetical protein PENSPDRAFT_655748 [Peniophora sp. CONT]
MNAPLQPPQMCAPAPVPPPAAVKAEKPPDLQVRLDRLEQLVIGRILPATRTLMDNAIRRPVPCELFDRLVAGAICIRAVGQTAEDAMRFIDGAHGFSAGQWALYLFSRAEMIQRMITIIRQPPAAPAPAAAAAPPAPIVATARKRSRSRGSFGSDEPEHKRARRYIPRAAKMKKLNQT